MKRQIENLFEKYSVSAHDEQENEIQVIHEKDFENMINEIERQVVKLFARGITQRMLDAEDYVRKYIKDYGKPPTYRQVAKIFNIAVNAAYARLRHCRELMVRRK